MAFKQKANNKGFTIVELMIAVSVFAIVMVMVMGGVLFISKQYQQASTRVALEDASRNVHQQVTQAMKYSSAGSIGSASAGAYDAQCIGGEIYVWGHLPSPDEAGYNSLKEGLFVGELPNTGCNVPASFSASNTSGLINILPLGSKVGYFEIDPANDAFTTVFVKIPSTTGADLLDNITMTGASCDVTLAGKEFCSVVKLNSTVTGRVNQ